MSKRMYRFSVFLVFITSVALLYVHQQVQLLKISYKINSSESEISRLLDQNRSLVYNVNKLKSPVYLQKQLLATKKDFAIPKKWQVIEVAIKKEDTQPLVVAKAVAAKAGMKSVISKIFGKPREAMANPVK